MSPAVDGSCRQPVKTQRILRRIKCIHGSSKVNADELRALSNASSARMVITLPQRFSTAPFARAGLTNVGALFGKMCGGPFPPPLYRRVEDRK